MISASLEIDGNRYSIEVLSVKKVDQSRTAITVRSQASFQRGRSCVVRTSQKELPAVVFNSTQMGDAYILEVRCLEDGSFLVSR